MRLKEKPEGDKTQHKQDTTKTEVNQGEAIPGKVSV